VSLEVVVYVLTALAAVVVVLTRLRLREEGGGAGCHDIGTGLLNVHTLFGVLALGTWLVFLVAPGDSAAGGALIGVIALGLWWVTVLAGLLLLVRWLPSRGRHASGGVEDSWSEGPGLSILAHVGLLVGVLVFSYAYLTAAV
jgi:hypothetical protein